MLTWPKAFFLLFILGLLVYSNSLNNKFLIDDYAFLKNPFLDSAKYTFSQWNPYGEEALGIVDQEGMVSYYRPMAHMLYDVCYAVFKNNFWQYHLLNLLLFVLAASLAYLLIGKLSGNYNLAFLASLFYLIHPVNGIVVNYISASVFALEVICILGTILLLWGSLEKNDDRGLYFLSLLLSFLSLFWHESGVMTPFYLAAVILLFSNGPYQKKMAVLFPYFLIVFFYIGLRFFFVSFNETILEKIPFFHMTAWEFPASLFQVFSWYMAQWFFPRSIVMAWTPPVLHECVFWNNVGAVSLLLFFFLLFIRFSQQKICQLAVAFILIGFLPACVAAFRRPDSGVLIEPHWFIFSSIGFFILAAYFFLMVLDRSKKAGWVLLFAVIFAWAAASHAYNQRWADQKSYDLFWSQQAPNLKSPYAYLAYAYGNEGAFQESRKYYRLALTGYTSDFSIYADLGLMDAKQGHWREAELNYRKALSINHFSASTFNNLGDLYLKEGRLKKARECFSQALVYNPLLPESRAGLAFIFFNDGQYQKAIDWCQKNLDIVNYDANTLFLLVDIYIHQKDLVNINKYAYRIISHETDPQVLMKLGIVMAKCNIINVAIDAYIKTIQVAPDYKDAYFEAGELLKNAGKYGQAIHIWELGSSIDPSDQRFQTSIAKAKELNLK